MPPPALPTETRAWASPRPMQAATGARSLRHQLPHVSCTRLPEPRGRTPMRTLGRLCSGVRHDACRLGNASPMRRSRRPPGHGVLRMGPSRLPTWLWTRSRSRCSAASRARSWTSAPASGSVTAARQQPRPGGGRLRQRRRPRSGRRLDRRPHWSFSELGRRGPLAPGAAPVLLAGRKVTAVSRQTQLVQEVRRADLSSEDRVHFGLGARRTCVRWSCATRTAVSTASRTSPSTVSSPFQDERDLQVDVEADGAVLDHDLLTVDWRP